jgi:hypothetical protein
MSKRSVLAGLVLVALVSVLVLSSAAGARAPSWRIVRAYHDVDVRTGAKATSALAPIKTVKGVTVVRGSNGLPTEIMRRGGYLSGPSTGSPETIVRSYLKSHAGLFHLSTRDLSNFVLLANARTPHNGITSLTLEQTDRGRPVYGAGLTFAVDRHGRILVGGGPYYPGLSAGSAVDVKAAAAVDAAADAIGENGESLRRISQGSGATRRTVFVNSIARDVRNPSVLSAELVTFPMTDGTAKLAWKTVVEANKIGWYETLIDARTGAVLFRKNLYESAGPEGNVYREQHPGISGATQQITPFTGPGFDNNGWVTDRNTSGNAINAYQDTDGNDSSDFQPQTPASGDPSYQHFDYNFTNAWGTSGGTDITTDQAASVTQLFYYANLYHDYLYGLGWTESFRNYQVDNFGRGGSGGDPVLAEADDSYLTEGCNANFSTNSDGTSSRMQMFVGKSSCNNNFIQRSMNGDTVFHEFTHGLSHRLVGGGSLGSGAQTDGMGEGWGDFIATSYWNDPAYGDYNNGDTTKGIRSTGYGTSTLKFSNLCSGGCEEHSDGEIWATVLWAMRAQLVDRYGLGTGHVRAEQLVVDAMKLSASSPSFLDERDKLLAADVADYSSANQCLIWGVFAAREMGVSATSASNQTTITTATDGPAGCLPTADAGGPYMTNEGTNKPLSGSASLNPGDPGTDPLTYAWDLDNDGQYDDSTSATPDFTTVGQDGAFTVGLKVTNEYGFSDTDSTTVTVNNVAPTTTLGAIGSVSENTSITASGSVTDPGWLDPLTATIDWGDGNGSTALSGTLENGRPDATLTYSVAHTYGDNGAFTVKVCAADDDTTNNCASRVVSITNVVPTAVLDETGTTLINGVPTFVAHAGQTIPFTGSSFDPGSDDRTTSWDWGDGAPSPDLTATSFNNGVSADPLLSPSINPRTVTHPAPHAFGDACFYTVTFGARDDDGDSATDTVKVIIAGNAALQRDAGYWQTQYQPRPTAFTEARRQCYLKIVDFMSTVFHEQRDAQTVANAYEVLYIKQNAGSEQQKLDRQLLTGWLNFANGAFDYNELVDTNGDHVADTAFSTVMATAEAARISNNAAQMAAQRKILEQVNG